MTQPGIEPQSPRPLANTLLIRPMPQFNRSVIQKMQWNFENIIMIMIKHLEMNRILALNNPEGVDMP